VIPQVEFLLFAATLAGVALLHQRAFTIALVGLCVVAAYKLLGPGFAQGSGLAGLSAHLAHEATTLANLFLLLTGFAVLARHFEDSRAPEAAPNVLPSGWYGGLALLALVFVLSAFLDNIAAALIGGATARHVFQGQVRVGYLAAIVAASNAGGAGSVVGDTTTTMMWISGVDSLTVVRAYVASIVAFLIFAAPAAISQHRRAPIVKRRADVRVDWLRLGVVALILLAAVGSNVIATLLAPHLLEHWPVIGLAVWLAILATALVRKPAIAILPDAAKGAVFLLALVLSASLMPIDALPAPNWQSTLSLGAISAVFDNIPLTALALNQGGYDWGLLAFAVGFGGSMMWFGSSAGVALAGQYPQARSALAWLRESWPIALAYLAGFGAYLWIIGWRV
jgi:Na+/H+ antiporter NhaD/arsenite permease-like protein